MQGNNKKVQTNGRLLLLMIGTRKEAKYPPNIPPAIAPAPINPKTLFASLALNATVANNQN